MGFFFSPPFKQLLASGLQSTYLTVPTEPGAAALTCSHFDKMAAIILTETGLDKWIFWIYDLLDHEILVSVL